MTGTMNTNLPHVRIKYATMLTSMLTAPNNNDYVINDNRGMTNDAIKPLGHFG
jgi:hypothetical protein